MLEYVDDPNRDKIVSRIEQQQKAAFQAAAEKQLKKQGGPPNAKR
jgi:hypothetical protein